MDNIICDFDDIRLASSLVEVMFGTTRWCGTINGMPALTLSYWSGATVYWFDGKWRKSISFPSLRVLHQRLGIEFT